MTSFPAGLRLPVIAAPLFLISNPQTAIAQCKAGIVGSFPALNAREGPGEPVQLEAWLREITEALDAHNQAHPDTPAAPFAVNQIVHRSNTRLDRDVDICARWNVPIWITSMGAREEVNTAAKSCNALTLHDVTTNTYARKAIAKGADGLIALCAGAGGHTGNQSPFALAAEIRTWFDGPLGLAGAISTGAGILGAQALGADFAYIGSPFIATAESPVRKAYKDMIVAGGAEDIVTTASFTGVPANFLQASIAALGLDPTAPPAAAMDTLDTSAGAKPWRDIWGAGEGIGAVQDVCSTEHLVRRLVHEYDAARAALGQRHA